MNKYVFVTLMVLAFVACKDDKETTPETQFVTTTYQDTVYTFFNRSADRVYHVANNGGNPIYERYYFGTNQNWTDVAQHFDMPRPRDTFAVSTIETVKMNGFRMRIAVQQNMGAKEDITYEIYKSDGNKNPEGLPIHTGSFTPNSSGDQDVVFDSEVMIDSPEGYLISFHTYEPGSDIFVLSNSYCVVANGPNDGRGERRTRVKDSDSGNWTDILESGPSFNQDSGEDPYLLDCDMYVFPFLSITEKKQL